MTKQEIMAALDAMPALELAQFVKELQEHWGVSAAVAVAAPAAGGAAPAAAATAAPVEEQTEFTVILKEFGPNKINVIKVVRELTSLGLKEAKDLVEAAPKPVKENVNKADAQQMREKLEAAGATVEVK